MKKSNFSKVISCSIIALFAIFAIGSCKKSEEKQAESQQEILSPKKNTAKVLTKGDVGSHDPSGLVFDGAKFYQFTTGDGIYSASSPDLIAWKAEPNPVFPIGTWPAWINTAVPGFAGTFWAPDVINLNGKWYIYYSCSTFGSSKSAIGVATSNSLQGPWTDLGMVVSSSSSSNVNAIDPGLFKDTDGRVYMTYGSFSAGIGNIEIDPATAKVKAGATLAKVAGGGGADWEAPYLIKEGSYYYLFANRGFCCRGVNSTYYIQVGRSTSPLGPFSGWRTVLGSSGKYIGPGHVGLIRYNGANFTSIHYYDGTDNGNAKLDIVNMGFSGGWPFLTRDWVASGTYKISNVNSDKVWDAWGCTGAAGQAISQNTYSGVNCQKWSFTPTGDGSYKVASLQGGRNADLINCGTGNGTKLQLWDWLNNDCQKFRIDRTASGSHVFTPLNSAKVLEIPGASITNGVQLSLWDYNGGNNQKWTITAP